MIGLSKHKKLVMMAGLAIVIALTGLACTRIDNGSMLSVVAASPLTTQAAPEKILEEIALSVSGLVERPLTLSYEDVLRYPPVTETAVLYCPGVYENQPTREWYGVPVTAILEKAGLKPEASRLIFYASDGYTTTLSIERIADTGAILAYKVDGASLPRGDGYPFRLVSREMEGDVWIRWVVRIEVA